MFIRFIEERSFVTDGGYQGLAFFDECTEKVSACDESTNEIRFVDWDITASSDRTKYILPLEPNATADKFTYPTFTLNAALLKPPKNHLNKLLQSASCAPGSPMARRTKYEIKMSQKIAKKCQSSPEQWANHLLTTCYSIYFLVLPSILLDTTENQPATLKTAYDVLSKAHKMRITCDEVCYRVMMQLCGVHNLPILAVRLYYLMKRSGIQPNAVTYGFYNRCVLEAQWPSDTGTASKLRWTRLKNVILGVSQFRRALQNSTKKSPSEPNLSTLDTNEATSATSLDNPNESTYFSIDLSAFDKLRGRLGNLVRPSDRNEASNLVLNINDTNGQAKEAKINGKDHAYDPHTMERITADNIELIREPMPDDAEMNKSPAVDTNTDNSNLDANGLEQTDGVEINGSGSKVHSDTSAIEGTQDADDDTEASPKK